MQNANFVSTYTAGKNCRDRDRATRMILLSGNLGLIKDFTELCKSLGLMILDLPDHRTDSVPCDREEWKGVREADLRARQREAHNLCLYQASSRGGGCNLARFGSPEPGLL